MSDAAPASLPAYTLLPTLRTRKEVAVEAALAGWRVHPCRHAAEQLPGGGIRKAKTPLLDHWNSEATDDPAEVEELWTRWPQALVGICTGAGVVMLDFDTDPSKGTDAATAQAQLEAKVGAALPATVTLTTARGGFHHYYTTPQAVATKQVGCGVAGFDTRGEGGYVVIHGDTVPDVDAMAELPAAYLAPAVGLRYNPAPAPAPIPTTGPPIVPDAETRRLITEHLSAATPAGRLPARAGLEDGPPHRRLRRRRPHRLPHRRGRAGRRLRGALRRSRLAADAAGWASQRTGLAHRLHHAPQPRRLPRRRSRRGQHQPHHQDHAAGWRGGHAQLPHRRRGPALPRRVRHAALGHLPGPRVLEGAGGCRQGPAVAAHRPLPADRPEPQAHRCARCRLVRGQPAGVRPGAGLCVCPEVGWGGCSTSTSAPSSVPTAASSWWRWPPAS